MKLILAFILAILSVDAFAAGVPVSFFRNDYASTNVTTSAYLTVSAALPASVRHIALLDTSGKAMLLSWASACGSLASTVNTILIPPNSSSMVGLDLSIIQGQCVGIKALSASATSGEFDINFFN